MKINSFCYSRPKTTFEIIFVPHVERTKGGISSSLMQMHLTLGSFDLTPEPWLSPLYSLLLVLYLSQHSDPVKLRSTPSQAEPFAQNLFKNSTTGNSSCRNKKTSRK